jgi:hypothetical protein
MTAHGRVSVSYGLEPTKLQRLHKYEAAHAEMLQQLRIAKQLWDEGPQTLDQRRDTCTAVAAIMISFAKAFDTSEFAKERVTDLIVGLGELTAGRKSALLSRANRPTRTPAASDLLQQATAQVCVDLYRQSGVSADDARRRTARLFLRKGFKQFGYSKLKSLGSRLTGPGATMDPLYSEYGFIKGIAARALLEMGANWPPSEDAAAAVAETLVATARNRDHRLSG